MKAYILGLAFLMVSGVAIAATDAEIQDKQYESYLARTEKFRQSEAARIEREHRLEVEVMKHLNGLQYQATGAPRTSVNVYTSTETNVRQVQK